MLIIGVKEVLETCNMINRKLREVDVHGKNSECGVAFILIGVECLRRIRGMKDKDLDMIFDFCKTLELDCQKVPLQISEEREGEHGAN